ncbi:Polysaccharide biosynthesis family protein [Sphingomonas sp. RIT328]|nr:Polysaccharide biosynthesis family protein [Sphingomonas sp. RIT328]
MGPAPAWHRSTDYWRSLRPCAPYLFPDAASRRRRADVTALTVPTPAPAAVAASHRTALASILAVGGRLLSRLIDLVALIVLARLLQPADFGLISIAMSLIFIVEAVMELPVSQVLLVERDITRSMMDTAFTLSVLRGVVLAVLIGAAAWPFAIVYGDMRLLPLILALALAPAFRGINNPRLALYNRDLDFRRTVATELLGKLVSIGVSIGVAVATGSYWALALGTIASPVTASLMSFVLAPYRPTLSLKDWRLFRNFLSWLSGAQLFSAFAWQMDRLVLGRLAPTASVGRFTMADSLASIPGQVLLTPILGPLSAGLVAVRDDPARLRQAYLKTFAAVALLGFPILAGTALLAHPVVSLALGAKWDMVAPILQWLALAGIPGLLWTPLNALALALRRSTLIFNRQLTDFLVKVPLVIAGAWFFLIPGIAAARAAAALVLAGMAVKAARDAIDLPVWAQLKAILRPVIGCLVMGALVYPATQWLPADLAKPWLVAALAGFAALGALGFGMTVLLLWQLAGRPQGGEAMVLGIATKMLRRGRGGSPAPAAPAPTRAQEAAHADARDQIFALANASSRSGAEPAASSVYRILDILMQANLVQPTDNRAIEGEQYQPRINLVCSRCGQSTPVRGHAAANIISVAAGAAGFHMTSKSIDVAGHCERCPSPSRQVARPYPRRP